MGLEQGPRSQQQDGAGSLHLALPASLWCPQPPPRAGQDATKLLGWAKEATMP